MRIWRRHPKGAIVAFILLVSALSLAELILVEIPRANPGRWPIELAKWKDEFGVDETLLPNTEYTFTVRAGLADPQADRLYGKLDLHLQAPGTRFQELIIDQVPDLYRFQTGDRAGVYLIRGHITGWSPRSPKDDELRSVELILSGGPRPWPAWAAVCALCLCMVVLTGLAAGSLGMAVFRRLAKRSAESSP